MKRLYIGDTDISNMLILDGDYVNVPFTEPTSVNYLLVAGGGGGGSGEDQLVTYEPGGAGGGAGGIVTGSTDVQTLQYIDVVVGTGGNGGFKGASAAGSNGGNSTFNGVTAIGGGGGGNGQGGGVPECTNTSGRDGGSGGGAGAHPLYSACAIGSALQPSSTDGGFGNDGFAYGDGSAASGGGGGAGGPAVSNAGGPGWTWEEDGQIYGVGGTSNSSPANNTLPGSGGYGGVFDANGMDGIDGVAVIWYEGPVRGFGGTITQSGGKTYHTFTSDDTLYLVR
jgi:hypothetical protein